MAIARFIGQVRGYTIFETGEVHLLVDDTGPSEIAVRYVNEEEQKFNPSDSRKHGYGCKDVPCKIRPGFSSYSFTLSQERAKGISFGSLVDVEIDVYLVRKVRFVGNRWAPIPEMRTELVNIRLRSDKRADVKSEQVADKVGK